MAVINKKLFSQYHCELKGGGKKKFSM